ncbi:MAG: hypothetical protein LBE13_20575 [Bacteroidales bacterium]|jgi:hypothetical protein|nr:hypothetical protein [Bacteroidales bacterium]
MIVIKEVTTKKEIKQFIHYPKRLYKNCPCYVPPLDASEYKMLTAHPAKSFCDIRLWLAYKNNKIAGRIGGIINHRYNELKDKKRIRFGWFDVDDDIEIAKALLQTVEKWGKEEHLLEISGPSRYSNMEKQGMLTDGFDVVPSISCEYNYPYYPVFMDKLGYEKEEDYLQFKTEIKEIPDKIKTLSHLIAQRYKVSIKEFKDKKDLLKYARSFFYALNKSFMRVYNFIPLTDDEIEYLIKNNFSIANKDLIGIIVDETEQVVGFSFCLPSLSKALQKAQGRLFPCGWYHIFKALKKNDTIDFYLTGVLPQWRGINALYHYQIHKTCIEKGFKYGITNQQLESNQGARIWEKYGAKVITKRRCYLKKL